MVSHSTSALLFSLSLVLMQITHVESLAVAYEILQAGADCSGLPAYNTFASFETIGTFDSLGGSMTPSSGSIDIYFRFCVAPDSPTESEMIDIMVEGVTIASFEAEPEAGCACDFPTATHLYEADISADAISSLQAVYKTQSSGMSNRVSMVAETTGDVEISTVELSFIYTSPTNPPTGAPTNAPTNAPTDAPTNAPTDAPSYAPTAPCSFAVQEFVVFMPDPQCLPPGGKSGKSAMSGGCGGMGGGSGAASIEEAFRMMWSSQIETAALLHPRISLDDIERSIDVIMTETGASGGTSGVFYTIRVEYKPESPVSRDAFGNLAEFLIEEGQSLIVFLCDCASSMRVISHESYFSAPDNDDDDDDMGKSKSGKTGKGSGCRGAFSLPEGESDGGKSAKKSASKTADGVESSALDASDNNGDNGSSNQSRTVALGTVFVGLACVAVVVTVLRHRRQGKHTMMPEEDARVSQV